MERVMGIEPTCAAWEAAVLPLNYTRMIRRVPAGCCRPAGAQEYPCRCNWSKYTLSVFPLSGKISFGGRFSGWFGAMLTP